MKKIFLAVMILLMASSAIAVPTWWGGSGSSSIDPGGTGPIVCNDYSGGKCNTFTVNTALQTIGGLTPVLNKVIIGDGGTPSAWSVSSSALGTGAYATIANYAPLASPTFTGTAAFNLITANGLSITQTNGYRQFAMDSNSSIASPPTNGWYWLNNVLYFVNNTTAKPVMATDFSNSAAGALANGVTATTQAMGDNSTNIATTAYQNTMYTVVSTSGTPYSITKSGYYFNNTAGTYRWNLPTAAIGLQICVGNYAAQNQINQLYTSASGQYIYYKGVIGSSGGSITATAAVGNFICVVGGSTTEWIVTGSGQGTWTNN